MSFWQKTDNHYYIFINKTERAMIDVHLFNDTFQLPQTWGEVKLEKMIQLASLENEEDETTRKVKALNILVGIPEKLLWDLEYNSFAEVAAQINFIYKSPECKDTTEFVLGAKKYVLKKDMAKFSTREKSDIDIVKSLFENENHTKAFPKIISILLREEKQEIYDDEKANALEPIVLKEMSADDAMTIITFFLTGTTTYIKNILVCMQQVMDSNKKKVLLKNGLELSTI